MGQGADQASTHFQKPKNRKSVLYRRSGFQKNLSGYVNGSTPWNNQVHHILCCCLFAQADIKTTLSDDADRARYVNDCLWVTDWDVNRKENLVMMPTWGTYVREYTKACRKSPPLPPPAGPNNIPAHTRDHLGKMSYMTEIRAWLKKNVWNALEVQKEPHQTDLNTVLSQLQTGEDKWRQQLAVRGSMREGGTWKAWNDRKTNPKWHLPFSMTKPAWAKPRNAP